MGEAKNNPNAQMKANPAEALRKLIDTPLTEEEGKLALAEVDVQVKQLNMMKVNVDQQLAAAEFDRAIILRRMLNKPGEKKKPVMGEPTGGAEGK